jgi:hypothetical protein
MLEHKVNEEQRAAFCQLLQDELDVVIVREILFGQAVYTSPSFAVKKKPGPGW